MTTQVSFAIRVSGGKDIQPSRSSLETSGPKPLLSWQKAFVGYVCGLFVPIYFWTAIVAFGVAILVWARGRVALILFLCFSLGIGVSFALSPSRLAPPEEWNTETLVWGVIDEVRSYPGQRVGILASQVMDLRTNATMPGRLYWSWDHPSEFLQVGQEFTTRLKIRPVRGRTNFGLSSSEEHWHQRDVWHRAYTQGVLKVDLVQNQAAGIRFRLMQRVADLMPQNQGGAVLRALLFGDRFFLDPIFMERIRRSSLAHSLALSGLHLALVAGFGYVLTWGLGLIRPQMFLSLPRQKLGTLLALPLGFGYLWLGGFAPSLQRAALMLATMAVHQFLGTRRFVQDSLFLAMAVLVILDPRAVHDLSLQLSVLAVVGIILFVPYLSQFLMPLARTWVLRPLYHALMLAVVSFSANAFLLPILALYFGEISPHLWLNILWLPVLGLVVLPVTFLGFVCMGIFPGLAQHLFGIAAYPVLLLERGLSFLDQVGWLQVFVPLRPGGIEILGYWLTLGVLAVTLSQGWSRRRTMAYLGLGLGLMMAPALKQMVDLTQERMELTVLDTGMSQAVMVRSHTGKTLLIDGGGAWNTAYDPGRFVVAPALAWQYPPQVDYVFLSHMDLDHARGLGYILQSLNIGSFIWTGLEDDSQDSELIGTLVAQRLWPNLRVRAGDRLPIEPGLWLEVLHPPLGQVGKSSNNNSLVLRLVWKDRGLALIPGDIERQGIALLLASNATLDADVLILPHHGSRSSLSPRLYAAVSAQWAVAACGPFNRFSFPHTEVVGACQKASMDVLSTAEHGAVRFTWLPGQEPLVQGARSKNKGR